MKISLIAAALAASLPLSLAATGCAADTERDGAEHTGETKEALPISRTGGGSFQCSAGTTWESGTCTCDSSKYMDCNGMSTYCKNNGGDGTVTCLPLTTLCVCSY